MCVLDGDGRFEASNPAWHALLGLSEAELARKTFRELVHPDDLAASEATWANALDRGLPAIHFENRYRVPNDQWRWLSWVAVPEGGKVYCTARDITEAKRQAADVAERTAERDRIWTMVPDLLMTGSLDGRLLSINPAWQKVLGFDEAQLLSRPF